MSTNREHQAASRAPQPSVAWQESGTLDSKEPFARNISASQSKHPRLSWGGPGSGTCCAMCTCPVSNEEIGFELEFELDLNDEESGEGLGTGNEDR